MTKGMTVKGPRTAAGRDLAARAKREAWSNWEGLAQFVIPAIEAEAAQPVPLDAMTRAVHGTECGYASHIPNDDGVDPNPCGEKAQRLIARLAAEHTP